MSTGQAPEPPDPAPATTGDPNKLLNRLRAAAEDLEAKRDAIKPVLELRDQLIVEGHEMHKLSYDKLARAALCSKATIHGVLGTH